MQVIQGDHCYYFRISSIYTKCPQINSVQCDQQVQFAVDILATRVIKIY